MPWLPGEPKSASDVTDSHVSSQVASVVSASVASDGASVVGDLVKGLPGAGRAGSGLEGAVGELGWSSSHTSVSTGPAGDEWSSVG